MQSMMYALVDCNNFFVSCERVFNPQLRNKPVVVLSNNDGCVVSRSNEAKKLGIAMGVPHFKVRDLILQHGVVALSSNFSLYGDLSSRVMSVITQYFPEVDIYSIDEAFINLTTLQKNYNLYKSCVDLSQKIEQFTGIPVSIGIANSKTLAKVANQVAKMQDNAHRVFYLDSEHKTKVTLDNFAIRDIWGIGRQLEKKLHGMGVYTASELLSIPESVIKNNFNTMLSRTILELQGISCIELKDSGPKKQIMISRSFGQRVTSIAMLQEALATYTSMACEKLRQQDSVAGGIYVFLHTGLHGRQESIYKNSLYLKLPHRTADTREIMHLATDGLRQVFKSGFRYQKVGIILCDLSSAQNMQIDLFGHETLEQSEDLMQLVDTINQKFGRATIQFAAAGLEKPWRASSARSSKSFTSGWQDLPAVALNDKKKDK